MFSISSAWQPVRSGRVSGAMIDAAVLIVVHQAAPAWPPRSGSPCQGAWPAFPCWHRHTRQAATGTSRHKIGQLGVSSSAICWASFRGGGHDDSLRILFFRVDMLPPSRDTEGTRLGRCRWGLLRSRSSARHHHRDGLFLNLGHFGKAHALHGLVDGFRLHCNSL